MGNCYSIIKPHDIADCKNHSFRTKVFKDTQECFVCGDIIWNEGRSCKSCKFPCHKRCEYKVLTACATQAKLRSPKNEEIKQRALNQRNIEESKHKMMSPGVEVNTTLKSSDGPIRYTFDLDVDYITERVIAMSFPSGGPEAQYRSNLKDVVNMLKTKHQNHYIIFNLSKRRNDIIKMNDQVLDVGWHDSLAPPLERLCSICKQIETWLRKDPNNVVVLHCKGSRSPIGVVVLAYMNYISITANSESALDRYAMKRFMEAKTNGYIQPSQVRYEGYFTGLLTGAISINSSPLYLHHVAIHGVPNYDANGGCRPFIRIYQGMQPVYTSGVYTIPEGTTKFVISLDKALPLRGDILVKCYHKKFRSNTRDVVFRCQFHTTAVVEYRILFGKEDLDDSCTDARFPPFTKVEFIFSSTGDRLHNSDYVAHSNFPIDNSDDPLIRWDSYENFSKLVEGFDVEADGLQPNGSDNNNLPPGSTKYIYASDGSPYAQVQKPAPYGRANEPPIQSYQPQQQHSAPPSLQSNGPMRQNPYLNGPTAPNAPNHQPPTQRSADRGVERTPSGRQMDFKEQRDLEELLRGIEDTKGMGEGPGPVPDSPQTSPMAESPGNRRIVSVHAELKSAPPSMKKAIPNVRPIVEEEFENSPVAQKEESKPPITAPSMVNAGPIEEDIIAPERLEPAHSPPPFSNLQAAHPGNVRSNPVSMHPLPNGNAGKTSVPYEHANPTYDYTQRDGPGRPHRTGEEIEQPISEVKLEAGPVNVHSLESTPQRTEHMSPSRRSPIGTYEPQPLRAQQQKIKFVTKYEDEPDHPYRPPSQPQGGVGEEDGQLWLKRQQDRMRGPGERDRYQPGSYGLARHDPYPIQEPGIQPSYQSGAHHAPPRVGSYTPSYPMSGPHSPGSSVKSEPVTSSRGYGGPGPDNLSWLEQQQMKLRERRNRERLGMDPSHPLQVDTSYSAGQLPSQPSSISSVRSDVSGFSNTPYSQQRFPEGGGMATRRGYNPEPISVSQPPPRRGPPTPAQGYDNMATMPQGVVSPDQGAPNHSHVTHHHRTQITSPGRRGAQNATIDRNLTMLPTGVDQSTHTHMSHKSADMTLSGQGGLRGEGLLAGGLGMDRRIVRGQKLTNAHQFLKEDNFSDPFRKEQVVDGEMLPSGHGLEFQSGEGETPRSQGKPLRGEGKIPSDERTPHQTEHETSKAKEQDSGYCSSSSSNKSQSPKSGQGQETRLSEHGSGGGGEPSKKPEPVGGQAGFGHQTSQMFLHQMVSRSLQRNRSRSLDEEEPQNYFSPLSSDRTIPPGATKDEPKDSGGLGAEMIPTYDWVINRIRELRNTQQRTPSPGDGGVRYEDRGSHGVTITSLDSGSDTSSTASSLLSRSETPRGQGRVSSPGSSTGTMVGSTPRSNTPSSVSGDRHTQRYTDTWTHKEALPHTGLQTHKHTHPHREGRVHMNAYHDPKEQSLQAYRVESPSHSEPVKMGLEIARTSSPMGNRSPRSGVRDQKQTGRSRSETREYVPREGTVRRAQGNCQEGKDLWVQERSMHVHNGSPVVMATNLHDLNAVLRHRQHMKPGTNTDQQTHPPTIRSEKSRRVQGNLALTKELDDAMRTLQIWGDTIQALSSMCQEPPSSSSRNRSIESRPSHRPKYETPKRSQSLNRERPDGGTQLFINEPMARPLQGAREEAETNTNNSARVYSPNMYAPDTSLPSQSSSRTPVTRTDSLGGYESDSAIQCKPSKMKPGEAETWLQNPGGVPAHETEHWNRVEGLHLPEERSPRDMHSSNESIPNGGTTPKFPVGPKSYQYVQTCIAVVGRPPHGPDEPLPLSPPGRRSEDALEATLPRMPEPARKQIQPREPLRPVLPSEPDTKPTQAPTLHVRPLEPYVVGTEPKREEPIDVKSLEALLDTMSPVEARGGVPDRPTGPGPYESGRGVSSPPEQSPDRQGVLYTDIEIDPNRGQVQQQRPRYQPSSRQVPIESRVHPSSAMEAQSAPYQADPSRHPPGRYPSVESRQPADRLKPSLVEDALSMPRRQAGNPQTQPGLQGDVWVKPTVAEHAQSAPQPRPGPSRYQTSQPSHSQVPHAQPSSTPLTGPVIEEPISKTELSPTKVVIQDLPMDGSQRTSPHRRPERSPVSPQSGPDHRQPPVSSPSPHYGQQGYQQPPQGYLGQPTRAESPSARVPNAQHVVPQYVQQPQRAVVDRTRQNEQYSPPHVPSQQPIRPQQVSHQYSAPQEQSNEPVLMAYKLSPSSPQRTPASQAYVPSSQPASSKQQVSPMQRPVYTQEPRREMKQTYPIQQWQDVQPTTPHQQPRYNQQQNPGSQQYHQPAVQPFHQPTAHQQPMAEPYQPIAQQHRPMVQHSPPYQHQQPREEYQGPTFDQGPQHPQAMGRQPVSPHSLYQTTPQPGYQQGRQVPQSPGSEPPSISLSEATPPPKHVGELLSPIFQDRAGGEEAGPGPQQGMDASGGPPPVYPTYSDRSKGRPQPMYPTFSDRHRRGHPRVDEVFGAQNGNYRTLYDNRNRGRGSSESDGSAVSPGTTSPVRQAVSPAGPSPSPSGRSTPSNFYLMPFTSPYGSNSSLADPNKEHVRFVKDLSSWWYKPHITREEAISLLRDKQPGTFVVRDSNSFPGAFGLAIKVSHPPANTQPRKAGDSSNELIRHFLIEPNTRGVRLKGCANEPVFGSLSALIYQHTLTQLALPCKLVLPDADPAGVDSPDAIDPKSAASLLQQGAACNVIYLQCIDMESLTGPSAVREGITRVMNLKEKPKGAKVHLKVSLKGVTVTDKARKLFFRKHYPVESILYCGMDPGSRKVPRMEGQDTPDSKCFGLVCRKPGSLTDNQCVVFAEYEVEQPASAIVSFVTKVLLGSKQAKTP